MSQSKIRKRPKGEKVPLNSAAQLVALTRWAEELGMVVVNQACKEMVHDDPVMAKAIYDHCREKPMKKAKKERFPVLLGETVENPLGQRWTRVWCPFCVRYHYHGGQEGGTMAEIPNKLDIILDALAIVNAGLPSAIRLVMMFRGTDGTDKILDHADTQNAANRAEAQAWLDAHPE